jgi:hypothetical protein
MDMYGFGHCCLQIVFVDHHSEVGYVMAMRDQWTCMVLAIVTYFAKLAVDPGWYKGSGGFVK